MRAVLRRALVLAVALGFSTPARGAGARDLEKSPQAAVYRTLLAAVAAENFEAYKKCMTKASVRAIEKQTREKGLDPKKAMGLLKKMSPADLRLVALEVEGSKATLLATGKVFGEENRGTIDFEREDGRWKVASQSWTNRE